jgi:hypothetical protein
MPPTLTATISTTLPLDAEAAWRLLRRRDTLLYITRGALGFAGARAWPPVLEEGTELSARLWLLHLVPAWRHRLLVVEVDPTRRLLHSRESGGPVSAWNHDIWLEPAGPAACRYTDRVEIAAGAWTPLIWAFAQVFYRYRQARWRRLARRAGGAGPA